MRGGRLSILDLFYCLEKLVALGGNEAWPSKKVCLKKRTHAKSVKFSSTQI